jgi:type VI protein secretion system component Hcp
MHYNWCELRDTGFAVSYPHDAKPGDGDTEEETKQHLEHISLKKRVDWASTRLFRSCCQAGKAKIDRNKDDDDQGTIHKVMVEVCKDAGGEGKFAYLAIEYKNVRIINYSLDMSDPEPAETIEFEYDAFKLGYRKTNPYTGHPIGEMEWTDSIEGKKKTAHSSPTGGNQQSGSAVAAVVAAQGGSVGGAGSGGRSAAGNGSPDGALTTATEAAVGTNFPGVWGPSGFGVLPD